MFNACQFTFAGTPSEDYGLTLYDFGKETQDAVSFGNVASIIETRTTHRIQPIHYGVNYHEKPLEFDIVFGSMEPLERTDIEEIMLWLTGYQDYQWLSIDQEDLEHVEFRCLITEVEPLMSGWEPYAFKATVTCDCPYAYGAAFEQSISVSGQTSYTFNNGSSVRDYLRPVLTYSKASGVTTISIKNTTDNNREFVMSDLPSAATTITIDCNSGVITHNAGSVDIYSGFNGNMFRLLPGDNALVINGNGTLTISGRTLHNVGA